MLALSDFGTGAHGRVLAGIEGELAAGLTVLVDGSTVAWNCDNLKLPMAKLTSSQSFTIDMNNVMSGSQGVLKLVTDTASPITLTFDASFTNKTLNTTITTYTFPALTAQEYFLSFVVDGTTIEWVIGDIQLTKVSARLQRSATQSISTGATGAAIIFDVENYDDGGIWAVGSPTHITIPGSGDKRALITGYVQYAGIASAAGTRRVFGYVNGSSVSLTMGAFMGGSPLSNLSTEVPINFQIDVSGGDYIEIFAIHSQGSSLNVTCAVHVTIENR
jgi:hypothetical protein